ncbi:hypothetical protein [Porphyromonas pogonae]|uniref:hypothetical protein n=1 Tax=Porphyromonas pogonae TaxID=867595 RepID=UPI002E797E2B|nr:hypothetical protein [Porphyromonas pogonae]
MKNSFLAQFSCAILSLCTFTSCGQSLSTKFLEGEWVRTDVIVTKSKSEVPDYYMQAAKEITRNSTIKFENDSIYTETFMKNRFDPTTHRERGVYRVNKSKGLLITYPKIIESFEGEGQWSTENIEKVSSLTPRTYKIKIHSRDSIDTEFNANNLTITIKMKRK